MSLIERLQDYCLTPAMSGFEDEMVKKLSRDLKDLVHELTRGHAIVRGFTPMTIRILS